MHWGRDSYNALQFYEMLNAKRCTGDEIVTMLYNFMEC